MEVHYSQHTRTPKKNEFSKQSEAKVGSSGGALFPDIAVERPRLVSGGFCDVGKSTSQTECGGFLGVNSGLVAHATLGTGDRRLGDSSGNRGLAIGD